MPLVDAVKAYEAGTLTSSGEVCEEHQHEGQCHS